MTRLATFSLSYNKFLITQFFDTLIQIFYYFCKEYCLWKNAFATTTIIKPKIRTTKSASKSGKAQTVIVNGIFFLKKLICKWHEIEKFIVKMLSLIAGRCGEK